MAVRRILRKGDCCPAVAVLQAVFRVGNFWSLTNALNGQFTADLEADVVRFQRAVMECGLVERLVDDGEVADKTFRALRLHLNVDIARLPDEYWPQE